jgi:hypothetical protein
MNFRFSIAGFSIGPAGIPDVLPGNESKIFNREIENSCPPLLNDGENVEVGTLAKGFSNRQQKRR